MEHFIIYGLNAKETFVLLVVVAVALVIVLDYWIRIYALRKLAASVASDPAENCMSDQDEAETLSFDVTEMAGAAGHELVMSSKTAESAEQDFNSDSQTAALEPGDENKKASPDIVSRLVESLPGRVENSLTLFRHEKTHKRLPAASEQVVGSFLVYSNEELKKLLVEFRFLERKQNLSDEEKRQHNRLCNILTLNGVDLHPNIIG